ncbi:hypothetical protein EDC01DRAFT_273919 [Geopyxis carbonaria]|nr:hypothetical protein EDC01DRAFT_273919 [Geopyxis carbonaria]
MVVSVNSTGECSLCLGCCISGVNFVLKKMGRSKSQSLVVFQLCNFLLGCFRTIVLREYRFISHLGVSFAFGIGEVMCLNMRSISQRRRLMEVTLYHTYLSLGHWTAIAARELKLDENLVVKSLF